MPVADPIRLLPDTQLQDSGPVGRAFCVIGIERFRDAARFVWERPYGRTTDRADYRLVLAENRGTCSTKHALLQALAEEHSLSLQLVLEGYEMTAAHTPGIGETLGAFGLSAVPDAHCVLRAGPHRVDLTWPRRVPSPYRVLREQTIAPDQIGTFKLNWHRAFAREWAAANNRDPTLVWQAREACIAALSSPLPS